MPPKLKRILIANRGEIALRVLRSLRAMGLEGVAVYSECDAGSLPVRRADRALPIGPAPSLESYLRGDVIIEAARRAGCQAIHPGYGFLSERAAFARAVEDAGLIFIGPRPESIERLGDKVEAREALREVGIPPVPGSDGVVAGADELRSVAGAIGFPLVLKAAAGGGGKGIRVVRDQADLESSWSLARSEARNSFGSDAMVVERFLERARHVEVQVLGDGRGGLLVFEERDCSTQRRLQKVLEETPCPHLPEPTRLRLLTAVAAAMSKARYRSAGTLEFLLTEEGELHFLEMNTRIQVEHPVTEAVTGVDLVREQIEIASGKTLPRGSGALETAIVPSRGAAVEFRVNAEDPTRDWLPSTGTVTALRWPSGPGIRVDSALEIGTVVTPHYDSLVAKIIAHGPDRRGAFARLAEALSECLIGDLITNLPLGRALAADPGVLQGANHCQYLAERLKDATFFPGAPPSEQLALAAAAAAWRWSRDAASRRSRTTGRDGPATIDRWPLRPGEVVPYWSESP